MHSGTADKNDFKALDVASIAKRLAAIPAVARAGRRGQRAMDDPRGRRRQSESGLHRRRPQAGSVVAKQALPYVRLVGESWPLPLKRSFFEYHALVRQAEPRRRGHRCRPFTISTRPRRSSSWSILTPHIILRRGADHRAGNCRRSGGTSAFLPRARCFAAPTSPCRRPSAQARPRAVRRQCRALRHHREPGLHRSLFRGDAQPPYFAAARWHRRGTARRPRLQGGGAAAEAYFCRQRRKRCCMAISTPAR